MNKGLASPEVINVWSHPQNTVYSHPDFYKNRVTTIGAHPIFKNSINYRALFFFLSMTWLKGVPKSKMKKFVHTYPGFPGAVIEAAHSGMKRGLKVRKDFLNSTMVVISTSEKNVGVKVFSNTLHFFGAQSISSIEEAMELLFDHIMQCNAISAKIRERAPLTERTWTWVINNTQGEKCRRHTESISAQPRTIKVTDYELVVGPYGISEYTQKDLPDNVAVGAIYAFVEVVNDCVQDMYYSNFRYNLSTIIAMTTKDLGRELTLTEKEFIITNYGSDPIEREEKDNTFSVTIKVCVDDYRTMIPTCYPLTEQYLSDNNLDIDIDFANYLINIVPDYDYYSDLMEHFAYMRTAPVIVDERPVLDVIESSMINHNPIDLGFHVKRKALTKKLNGVNGFTAYYDNTHNDDVQVEITYDHLLTQYPWLNTVIRSNDKKKKLVRFNIPESGKMKLSGPCLTVNRWAYDLFMQTVMSDEIRPYIIRRKYNKRLRIYSPEQDKLIKAKVKREREAMERNIKRAQAIQARSNSPPNSSDEGKLKLQITLRGC